MSAHDTASEHEGGERERERAVRQVPGGLREVALLMFRFGWTAFGGPAAHIAMLRGEVVERRRWMSEQEYLDLIGAANLIPGPTSTEVVIHASYRRAGWPGMLVGGSLFILPAMLLVLAFAWLYVEYGTTPTGEHLLYGIKPVIIAVVAQAVWNLGRTALKGPFLAAVGAAVLALYLLGGNEIALLFGAALVVMLVANWRRLRAAGGSGGGLRALAWVPAPPAALRLPLPVAEVAAGASEAYAHSTLFVSFLKIGSVLYGSGYVLLAFLRNEFVERLGWLTEQQLLDAVAIGQFTPGPVFTTATFVGYLTGGLTGALVATLGIFLPAFVFVAISIPLLPKVRRSPWTAAALDGVNVAAIGLMLAVTWTLARAAFVDALTIVLALAAAALLIRWKVNSAWLVLAGGIIGIAWKGLLG